MDQLERIKTVLEKHLGKKNKIPSWQIAREVGIVDDATHAETRAKILECARKYKLPLAANTTGYYLITCQAEYEEYISNLEGRIKGINERIEIIRRNYKGE